MTLVDIEAPNEVRRDRWGRYVVLPPGASKPVGYQRATTLAKMLEDTSNLTDWACRMTLLGAAARPDIIASVLAADSDDRKTINALAAQAKEHGGANIRRDLGTAIHRFVELSHADPTYHVPEPYAADVAAINTAIDGAGFDVVNEYSERILVVDSIQVAGMCDLVLRRRSDGRLFIGDLKTGSSVKYGALGWATQLSIYSMADNIYVQGAAADGSDDQRLPAPDVDREQAFIIHCQPQSGSADIHALTIGPGFVELAVSVREMRKTKGLLTKFEGGDATSAAGTVEVVGSVEDNQPSTVAAPVTPEATSADALTIATGQSPTGASTSKTPDAHHDQVPVGDANVHEADVAWLINRTVNIVNATSKQHVAQVWPVDIPRPGAIKAGLDEWTAGDIDVICLALDALEAKHDLPFGDPRPSVAADLAARFDAAVLADTTPPPKLTSAPDDDGPAPDHYVLELKRLAGQMQQSPDPDVRARIARAQLWQRDANTAGVPWRTGLGPGGSTPMRVWAIGRAAIACTALVRVGTDDPDWNVRAVLAEHFTPDQLHDHQVGALFGALTTDQAIAIWDMAGDTRPPTPTTTAKDNNTHD